MQAHSALPRWRAWAVAYLCALAAFFPGQSIPPVLGLMMDEWSLNYAQGGSLMSYYSLPGALMAIPGGMLADRVGFKRLAVVCLATVLVGIAVLGSSTTFGGLVIARVLEGAGGFTAIVLSQRLVARSFAGKEIGRAMGLFTTANAVGSITALNVVGVTSAALGWRAAVWMPAAVVIAAIAVVVGGAPSLEQDRTAGAAAGAAPPLRRLGLRQWLPTQAWLWFGMVLGPLITFTPSFAQQAGYSPALANALASVVLLGSLAMAPVMGWLADRNVKREWLIGAGALTVCLGLLAVPSSGNLIVPFVLAALGLGCIPAPLAVWTSAVFDKGLLGLAYGLNWMFSSAGYVVGSYLVGWVLDATGAYESGFLTMAVCGFVIVITVLVVNGLTVRRAG